MELRQSRFDADKEIYPSKNVFEDAKALANHLSTKGWVTTFQNFLDQITMFDDSRLDKVTVITCMQEWSVILQKYSGAFLRVSVPNVAEDADAAGSVVPTSRRDAPCLSSCCGASDFIVDSSPFRLESLAPLCHLHYSVVQ